MEYSSLSELISFLEYGTKLHIGALFFGHHSHERLRLPHQSTIHASPVCEEMKSRQNGFARCYRCRNTAIRHALKTQCAFGGLCINGVYEYTRPIVLDGEVVCLVFIGNILPQDSAKITHRLDTKCELLDTMEAGFSPSDCERVGAILESYIRMLLLLAPKESAETDPLVENLKSYIDANLEYELDIPLLSQMFHYNEKYLGRLFKRRTGQSFSNYINQKRVERAKVLLKADKGSVLEISGRVGFNNVTYFNRLFRAQTGLSPRQYRDLHTKR